MSKPLEPRKSRAPLQRPAQASAGDSRLTSYTLGAMPLVNRILSRMRLREILESYLPPMDGRTKIPPAEGIELLVKNFLLSREPLYGIGEWAARYDPRCLGLSECQVRAINDDRLGRWLDMLFEVDQGSLALQVSAHVVREFDVSLEELHNDSTTVTFYGEYESQENGAMPFGKRAPLITHGHNKDHRPDLKQLLFVLSTSSDGSVPVHFNVLDGNTSDDQTHVTTWNLLRGLRGNADFLYVADCKLASEQNMAHIHREGGRFVTILPRTRREDRIFRERLQVGQVEWTPLYETYDKNGEVLDYYRLAAPPTATREGYRLLWIHSQEKEFRDLRRRGKLIDSSQRALLELKKKLLSPRTRWRDRGKLDAAIEKILSEQGTSEWINVLVYTEEEESYRQDSRGRPGPSTRYLRESRVRFDIEWAANPEGLQFAAKSDGVFPLVTNDVDLSAAQILRAYKRQPFIEKRFSQFKSDFNVAPVYLKSPGRVQALLCAYFFTLLSQALIERELRRVMEKDSIDSLPLYPEERACTRPCARRTLDLFSTVQRHVLHGPESQVTTFVTQLAPIQKKIVKMLDVSMSSYQT